MEDQHHQIGTVADQVGLSLRTIRYYEEIGLVTPSGRTDGGFRLYTDSDIDRLRLVKALKPVGMSLETMEELLSRADTLAACTDSGTGVKEAADAFDEILSTAHRKCNELEDRLNQARRALAGLDRLTMSDGR